MRVDVGKVDGATEKGRPYACMKVYYITLIGHCGVAMRVPPRCMA